jgi:hypothetical protein
MTISRNISVMAQGASSSGILAGGYGGLGASISPTTAGNVLFTTDGSVWSSTAKVVQGTVNAGGTTPFPSSAGPVAVDFTDIPSWVKRITFSYQSLSTSGTSLPIVRLGTGATPTYTTSGYIGAVTAVINAGASVGTAFSSGFAIVAALPTTAAMNGFLTLVNLTGNTWVAQSSTGRSDIANNNLGAGSVALGAVLTAVRLTMVNGTDRFDAGSVNILYE